MQKMEKTENATKKRAKPMAIAKLKESELGRISNNPYPMIRMMND